MFGRSFLSPNPPEINWEYQTRVVSGKIGTSSIDAYIEMLTGRLDWNSEKYTESQNAVLLDIMNECNLFMNDAAKRYTLVRVLLKEKLQDPELWRRFFQPLSTNHIRKMWMVTPYVPKTREALSSADISNMLHSVAHLFQT